MERIYESGATVSPPSPPASPSSGYPQGGDPQNSIPATKPGDYWFHQVTEEIVQAIESAGLTPDHTDLSQLAQAISILGGAGLGYDVVGNGYFSVKVGTQVLLVQWVTSTAIANDTTQVVNWPTPFGTLLAVLPGTDMTGGIANNMVTITAKSVNSITMRNKSFESTANGSVIGVALGIGLGP